jgi:hypothetical protein
MPNTDPCGTSNETPFKARTSPYDFERFFTERTILIPLLILDEGRSLYTISIQQNGHRDLIYQLTSIKNDHMLTVLITGGTGLIGKALGKALLEKAYRVIILSRKPAGRPKQGNLSYAGWNVEEQSIDSEVFGSADYIIHLAGAGVADKRWTKKRKQEIVSSRVESCKLIVKSLKTIPNNVKAVISSSGIGWYLTPNPSLQSVEGGSVRKFIESDTAAKDFLGTTCKQY